MKLFGHYILTRFNIVFRAWETHFPDHPAFVSRDNWMDERLSLFENYCLPSIQHQSCLDFKWIIVFNESTGPKHRRIIDLYPEKFDRILIVYSNEGRYLHDVRRAIGADYEYLITTRLDSDDALHEHAIRSLQKCFNRQAFEFFNFQNGYKYDLRNNRLFFSSDHSSPFVTLVEKSSNELKTIWVEQHQNIYKKYKATQLRDGRYWLQIVHGSNLMNRVQDETSPFTWLRHMIRSPHCALPDFASRILYDLFNPMTSRERRLSFFSIKVPANG